MDAFAVMKIIFGKTVLGFDETLPRKLAAWIAILLPNEEAVPV